MCEHQPRCPTARAPDRLAARVVVSHPEQGWSQLCNGVVLFDDSGALLPDGRVIGPAPHLADLAVLGVLSAGASLTAAALVAFA
jgi:hypothetical protein